MQILQIAQNEEIHEIAFHFSLLNTLLFPYLCRAELKVPATQVVIIHAGRYSDKSLDLYSERP